MRYGWLLAAMLVACKDSDDDGVRDKKDCLPDDPRANPDAVEVCDGVDNDCDGQVDEDVAITAYRDADDDGYGDPEQKRRVCELPDDGTTEAGDCDDGDPAVHPGVPEACNEKDDDCNDQVDEGVTLTYYADDDGDGHGVASDAVEACEAPAGYVLAGDDCDDAEPLSWQGAAEACDGVDNDCDGDTDEDLPVTRTWADLDGDGYGDPGSPTVGCGAVPGVADNALDCDDGDPNRSPDAFEVRGNAVDEDCDGFLDEYGVGPGNEFPTIDDALTAAPDGSVVQLDAGVHVGTVDLTGRDLTFAGEGCERTTLYADSQGTAVTLDAGRVVGMTISGGSGSDVSGVNTGGGVLVKGAAVLESLCVSDNRADRGGGIAVTGSGVSILDSTISENSAGEFGGGVWATWSATGVEVRRTRVIANEAVRGAGLYFGGSSGLVANTVVAANTCRVRLSDDVTEQGCGAFLDAARDLQQVWRYADVTFENDTFHANALASGISFSEAVAAVTRASTARFVNSLFTGHPDPFNLLEGTQTNKVNGVLTTSYLGFRGNAGTDLDLDTYLLERIDGAPLYVQDDPTLPPLEWDLRLRVGSEVVDQGDPAIRDRDGSRSDLGAYGGPGAADGWDWGLVADEDGDGVPSGWEAHYGTAVYADDAASDDDGDGSTVEEEFAEGTDPGAPDTDADGVDDGVELGLGTNAASPWDQAPFADAGGDRFALTGGSVGLDGAASFDPNGDALTYAWTLTSAPAGSAATVSAAGGAAATLDPDLPGTYVATLTVDDGATTRTDSVTVRAWAGVIVPDDEPTIEAALAVVPDGGGVGVRAGTYVGTWDTSGRDVALFGLDEADAVVLEGAGAGAVLTATGGKLAIGHLTVQGGAGASGGGVHADDLLGLDLQDVTLRWNRAVNGGGLWSENTPVVARDVRVLDNLADALGGGMTIVGGQHLSLVLEGSRLAGNVARLGGALHLEGTDDDVTDDSDYFLRATTFADNSAEEGAAWWHSGEGSDVRADGVTLVGNHGGSVVWADVGRDIVLDSVFDENDATLFFGAASASEASNVQVFGAVWDEVPAQPFWTGAGPIATSGLWVEADPMLTSIVDDGDRADDRVSLRGAAAVDAGFVEHTDRDGTRADAGACSGPLGGAECARGRVDVDADGLSDAWEAAFGLDLSTDDSGADLDGDGVTNAQEHALGTRPDEADTDSDAVSDATERRNGDDPRSDRDHRARAVAARVVYGEVGTQAALDGRASFDPDGDALTYRWRVLQAPVGSRAALLGASNAVAGLTPDVEGAYRLGLVVDDGDAPSRELVVWLLTPATHTVPGDFATVQEAYDAAGPNDTILLGADEYPLHLLMNSKPITLAGAGMDLTTLTAIDTQVVLQVGSTNDEPDHLTVRDLTITGGTHEKGGAILCRGGLLDLERVRLRDNVASTGGAMALDVGCEANLVDVELLRNHAASAGGAIWAAVSTLTIDGGRATQNESTFQGGAFHLLGTDTEIRNFELHRNSSIEEGSAILYSFQANVPPSGSLLLDHVTIAGNSAVANNSGAVHRLDSTPTTITSSLFLKNTSHGMYDQDPTHQSIFMDFNGYYGNGSHSSPANLSGHNDDLRNEPILPVAFDQDGSAGLTPDQEDLRLQGQSPYRDIADGDPDPDGSAPDMGAWGGPGARPGWDEYLVDSDGDGMTDVWESDHALNAAANDANQDRDGDGRTNRQEFDGQTDPTLADTDHDGVRDGAEVSGGFDPTDPTDHVSVSKPGGNDNTGRVNQPYMRVANIDPDPQGDPLTYRWTLTDKPGRSTLTTASLGGANTSTVTITPDRAGMYELTLVVGDGSGTSDPKSFLLRVVGDVAVPADYATVADAVFASWDGGRVLLAANTYREHVDLAGRDLTLVGANRDTTILDGDGTGRTLLARQNEQAVLQDLTLRNGVAGRGGNVYGEGGNLASITLDNVVIEDGRAGEGANLYLNTTDLTGVGVQIVGGLSAYRGGGLMSYYDAVDLSQAVVAENRAPEAEGGGMRLFQANLRATNVIFHDNEAWSGGAVWTQAPGTYVFDHVTATLNSASSSGAVIQGNNDTDWQVIDSIFANNLTTAVVADEDDTSTYVQTYTMSEGNDVSYDLVSTQAVIPVDGADGNLVENGYVPEFVALTDDGDWTNDDWHLGPASDAANAGDPASARDANGTRSDMGAHGGPDGVFAY